MCLANNRRSLFLLGVSALVMVLGAGQARAFDVVSAPDVVGAINTQVGTTNTAIGALNTVESAGFTSLIAAMRLQSGQQSANLQGVINSSGNVATTQDTRQVQMAIENKTFDAMNHAASGTSACNVITGAVAGQTLFTNVAAFREQAQQAMLDLDIGGSQAASSRGQQAAKQALVTAHCKYNSTPADITSGMCTGAPTQPASQTQTSGSAAATAADVPDDINAAIFLSPTNDVMNPAQQQAARLFVAHAFTPDPMGPLPAGGASTQAGKMVALERMNQAALGSIPSAIISDVMSRVTPYTDTTTQTSTGSTTTNLSSWMEGTADQTLGYSKLNGKYFPNGVSYDAWLALRARSWYMNPTWGASMNSGSADQATKDGVMITSFNAVQLNEIYKESEKTNVLLAGILSILRHEQTPMRTQGLAP